MSIQQLRPYFTIEEESAAELVEKKSRFIALAVHVETEEEALSIIEDLRKRYYDARHNCYAYRLGASGEIAKSSDDGEPSGTAGRPMMDILVKKDLTDILVVVTRYFGGVLLGTGGLVRAYSGALSMALDNADVVTMIPVQLEKLKLAYSEIGKIKYILNESDVRIIDEQYGSDVELKVAVPTTAFGKLASALKEATSGEILLDYDIENVVYLKS
jgi:uncharacterized YigZ family protein